MRKSFEFVRLHSVFALSSEAVLYVLSAGSHPDAKPEALSLPGALRSARSDGY